MKLRTLKHYTIHTGWNCEGKSPELEIAGKRYELDAGSRDEIDVFHEPTNHDLLFVVSKNWNLDYIGVEFISLSGDVEPESIFFQGEQCNEVHPQWNELTMLNLCKVLSGWMQ